MTQTTSQIGADQSGLAYRNADNAGKQAILNHHKGSTAPGYAEAGIIWLNDSATPWKLNVYDGSDWITLGEVNATNNTFQSYNGTAVPRVLNHATDTGSANAYAVAPAPAVTAYATGQIVTLKPANANTGASTINVNSLGTKNIKLMNGNNPAAGALLTTGVYALMYDGTNFVVLNPSQTFMSIAKQTFSTSGTYTPTAGMLYAVIECMGGGGAGGGVAQSSTAGAGGGGGAGGYSRALVTASSVGTSQTVTIGAGGSPGTAGNNAGGNGGNTSVGTLCVAGGSGGYDLNSANQQGGAGAGGFVIITEYCTQ